MKNVVDFEKKNMLLLTKKELRSQQDTKVCYICGKRFRKDKNQDKIQIKTKTTIKRPVPLYKQI